MAKKANRLFSVLALVALVSVLTGLAAFAQTDPPTITDSTNYANAFATGGTTYVGKVGPMVPLILGLAAVGAAIRFGPNWFRRLTGK